jgi:hypothetical protein
MRPFITVMSYLRTLFLPGILLIVDLFFLHEQTMILFWVFGIIVFFSLCLL